MRRLPALLVVVLSLLPCALAPRAGAAAPAAPSATSAPAVPPAVQAAVQAPDRTPEDRALDAGRHPAQMLAFFEIRPGERVAELGAGGGYTTELLARVVGPEGSVYGHNTPFILERFAAAPWS